MSESGDELEATIREQVDEWSTDSNEAVNIQLLRGDGHRPCLFKPDFTYPIFGEEEKIFGYQELDINLSFAAHNLKPLVTLDFKKKFEAIGDVEATDINAALADFLPESAFVNDSASIALRDEQASTFSPPGEKIHEYTRDDKKGKKYEIWVSILTDARAKELLENMQILVPMFIEGGSTLQLEQDWTTQRWKLFLLYEVDLQPPVEPTVSPYCLVGYGTSYRVFTLPDRKDPSQADLEMLGPAAQDVDSFLPPPESKVPNAYAPTAMPNDMSSPLDLPSRERLSQFLILPFFKGSGHGSELYNCMYKYLTSPTNVREFTVEDPNEAFDDLRDVCDLLALRADPEFAALRINTDISTQQMQAEESIPTGKIIPETAREAVRKSKKIMRRQFDRLVEMHTLSFIPPANRSRNRITRKLKATNEHDKAYYLWRMYVKARLYIFNRDQLIQVEKEERIEKLEAALDGVIEKYVELLDRVENREAIMGVAIGGSEGQSVGGAKASRKRKVVDDEDDEAEEMMRAPLAEELNGNKKARVV